MILAKVTKTNNAVIFSATKTSTVNLVLIEYLKGLSHEIDFKNFDKDLQNLA